MGIQTRSIDSRMKQALRSVPYDQITLNDVIPMTETEIRDRSARDSGFAEKVEEVKFAVNLAHQSNTTIERAKRNLNLRVAQTKQSADQARTAHVQALRAVKEVELELNSFNESENTLDSETVESLIRDTRVISALEQIETVTITDNGQLLIKPKPLVISYEGDNYLLNDLSFVVSICDLVVSWAGDRISHPHVDTNGTICWGDAHNPLRDMRRQGNLAATVKLVLDWMTFYNPDSPYFRLPDHFQETDLPEGWQI